MSGLYYNTEKWSTEDYQGVLLASAIWADVHLWRRRNIIHLIKLTSRQSKWGSCDMRHSFWSWQVSPKFRFTRQSPPPHDSAPYQKILLLEYFITGNNKMVKTCNTEYFFSYIFHTIRAYLPLVVGRQSDWKEPLTPKPLDVPKNHFEVKSLHMKQSA